MVNEKKYSELLCMFSLNYQILDTSRANYILLQKGGGGWGGGETALEAVSGCFLWYFL